MPRAPADPQRPRVELLWFQDCPNRPVARVMLRELLSELSPATTIWVDAAVRASLQRHLAIDPSPRPRRPRRPGAHLGATLGRELSDERG